MSTICSRSQVYKIFKNIFKFSINDLCFISEQFLIFSGGMPRACYGDRHAVTVRLGTTKHVAFELTSKVIDFFTTTASVDEKGIIIMLLLK